jgi:hypothetical protein
MVVGDSWHLFLNRGRESEEDTESGQAILKPYQDTTQSQILCPDEFEHAGFPLLQAGQTDML